MKKEVKAVKVEVPESEKVVSSICGTILLPLNQVKAEVLKRFEAEGQLKETQEPTFDIKIHTDNFVKGFVTAKGLMQLYKASFFTIFYGEGKIAIVFETDSRVKIPLSETAKRG